jgi:ADP-ribose pyrophosphatase
VSAGDALPADDALAHLRETLITPEQAFKGHFLDVRRDTVRLPSGRSATREYIVHPGAAMIVPLHADSSVTLVRQFRYPVGRAFLEFPAGKRDHGDDFLATAKRELEEEVGLAAARWTHLTTIHNAIAYSDEAIALYLAEDLAPVTQRLDEGEFLDVVRIPLDKLLMRIDSGEVSDVKTIVGAMWVAKKLRRA